MNYLNLKWVVWYIIIAVVAYGLVYYFFFAKDAYDTVPAVNNDQELMSASADLEATNVDQIDEGLDQNDQDASAF